MARLIQTDKNANNHSLQIMGLIHHYLSKVMCKHLHKPNQNLHQIYKSSLNADFQVLECECWQMVISRKLARHVHTTADLHLVTQNSIKSPVHKVESTKWLLNQPKKTQNKNRISLRQKLKSFVNSMRIKKKIIAAYPAGSQHLKKTNYGEKL